MLKETARYGLNSPKKVNRGSKIIAFMFFVVLVVVPGAAYYLYDDTPGLIKHIKDRDHLATISVHMLAHKVPPANTQELLKVALMDSDMSAEFRQGAAKALGHFQDRELTTYLAQSANEDPSPKVRAAAIRSLGDNGEDNARRYLIVILRDEDSEEGKQAAAYAVGALGLEDLIPGVIAYLHSTSTQTRTAAVRALETFTGENESYGQDVDLWTKWHDK
jgi:HEAT repeat protein